MQRAIFIGLFVALSGCQNGYIRARKSPVAQGFALRTDEAKQCLDQELAAGDTWTPTPSTDTRPVAASIRTVQADVRIFRSSYSQPQDGAQAELKSELVCERKGISIPLYDQRPEDYWKYRQELTYFTCESLYHGHPINVAFSAGALLQKRQSAGGAIDERRIFWSSLAFRSVIYEADRKCLSSETEQLQEYTGDLATLVKLDTPVDLELNVGPFPDHMEASCSSDASGKSSCSFGGREAVFRSYVIIRDPGK